MKFVHLTTQPRIPLLRKNGIRAGTGRHGPGVYAVPLVRLERASDASCGDRLVASAPRSSADLWRWLTHLPTRHRHAAAVVFRTGAVHWPARLHLLVTPEVGLVWTSELPARQAAIDDRDREAVASAHRQGAAAMLALTVADPRGLGAVLRRARRAGFRPWDHFDESLEVVLPRRVPSQLIERIVPLYRPNGRFRQARHRRPAGDGD